MGQAARQYSIQWRLPLVIAGLLALVVVAFAGGAYREVRRAALESTAERLEAVAGQLATIMEESASERVAETERLALAPGVLRFVQEGSPAAERAARVVLARFVEASVQTIGAELLSATGESLLRVGPEIGAGAEGLPVGRPGRLRARADTVYYEVAAPVGPPGRPVAYVLQRRSVSSSGEIARLIEDLIGSNAVFLVGDADGGTWTNLASAVVGPPLEVATAARPATYERPGGDAAMGLGAAVPGTPWRVWVEFPEAVILARSRAFLWQSGLIALVLLLVGSLTGWLLSRRISVPLRQLTDAAAAISAGDYSRHVEISRRDELGRLAATFNVMTVVVQDTQQQLEEQVVRLRQLAAAIEASSDGIAIADREGRFTYLNRAMATMYGYPKAEYLLGQSWRVLYGQAEVQRFDRDVLPHVARTGRWAGEATGKRADGSGFPQQISMASLADGGFVCIDRDLSGYKALEEQFQQAQKLESVGRLAGGIAHDFNNILTAIIGSTEILLHEMSGDDPHRPDLEEIRDAARRAATLTGQLLAFSRKQVMVPRVLDLNVLVGEAERLLGRVIGEDIILRTVPNADPARVEADPGQLEQVIMNLVVNARDAMPEGGVLTITTSTVAFGEGTTIQHVPVQPGDYVLLTVADTGTGIDQATLDRLFEPFFTTKGPGRGTGLGLATVYGIVKQSGGFVFAESTPGQGSAFKVYLPVVDRAVDAPQTAPAATDLRGSETVLLVEDDAGVRRVARRFLVGHGYEVIEAAAPTDGLARAAAYEGPIHLVLSDIVMPDMSGGEFAERLGAVRSGLKVLFMSGYTEDAAARYGLAGSGYIEKPFTAETLLRKVREALDGNG